MIDAAAVELYVSLMSRPYPLTPAEYHDAARGLRYSADQLQDMHRRAADDAALFARLMPRREYPALRRAIRRALDAGRPPA